MAGSNYNEKIREMLKQNLKEEEREINKIDREIALLKKERKRKRRDLNNGEKLMKELNIPIKKKRKNK